ncbi:MAG: PEGA domain-containing protein [Kiritimatiellales bacterium]
MIKRSIGMFFVLSLILAICSCAPTTINTIPPGAGVYGVDGKTQLGTTPFDVNIFVSEKNFTVRKDRYFDEPVMVNFESSRTIDLKLRTVPVLVYSKPDAAIYPAGSETSIGNTPMKVQVGDNAATYTLKAKDYYDKEITVGIDSADPLVVELARRPFVTISASPEGVGIYENDKLIGLSPVREEILTSRTFELRKENYFTQRGTITGAPPYEVRAVLRPFPVITVSATPSGAQISRAGSVIGKDSVKLPVGDKIVLDVSADRYYKDSVTLTPESSAEVFVALKAMPYVMINSQPAGAKVVINGATVGVTPVEQLIEKDTVIEVSKEGFIAKTATLTGADKQVAITLEAVPAPVVSEAPAKPVKEVAKKEADSKLWIYVAIGVVGVIALVALVLFMLKRRKLATQSLPTQEEE